MWAVVASRLHTPVKIFPFGEGSKEVMLYGTVAYGLKDGRKTNVSSPVVESSGREVDVVGSRLNGRRGPIW